MERRIEGTGTLESDWQRWAGLAALPTVTAQQLVPPGSRAVIVAPHPDDELLACGGLLQLLAQQHSETLIVAVTDGDASHPDSPLWSPQRLRRERPLETRQALRTLGLASLDVMRLGLPDGHVASHVTQLREALGQVLRAGDVVFATWQLDGHPDHEAVGRIVASAAAANGAMLVETPVWGWHWAEPGDLRMPWPRACRLMLSDEQLQRKRDAVDCYHSQLAPDASTGQPAIVPPTALQRLLRPYEVYFL